MDKNPKQPSRSEQAGKRMAKAIIEMVHLMYQDRTALHFYSGLVEKLKIEQIQRAKKSLGGATPEPEVPECPKCRVAHYPTCEQQGKTEDTPELKITGQDRTNCPYKICLKEKCEFYPNDCSVIRAHKWEVEP